MAEKKNSGSFTGGATPTVTTKKTAPGKKKVIRRLIKNAKTGEVIKTEIVRIDSNGEMTVTSYPAGTPVPSLGGLQAASGRKSRSDSPGKKESPHSPDSKASLPRSDIGPSVPASMPGLEDLLEKEKELLKAKNQNTSENKEERKAHQRKSGEEDVEATLISIMKRKRQRDPKSRRRGLMASTMSRRADSDEEQNEEGPSTFAGDTDYRMVPAVDEEEENKKRKERHRRRKEKKHKEKPAAYRDGEPPDSGIDAQNDQRPYDPEDEEQELHPLEEAELLAKQLQASALLKQNEQVAESHSMEQVPTDAPSPAEEKTQMSDISDDDLDKPKKKKKKHKNKKKKKKKQKRKSSDNEDDYPSDRSIKDRHSSSERDKKVIGLKKEEIDELQKRSLSRSNSFSSLTLSSISSEFSDSFDFAENVMMPMADFDRSMFRGGFRGRGGFVQFRGRAGFRGYPRGRPPRGAFRGGRGGFPVAAGGMFPEGMDVMGNPMFMGRGVPGMWRGGPWGPMMPGGRGGVPFNNPDDGGIGIYVEDESEGSRSRSYSSYSSYSSRSRSRSRRRHRRRHRSSSRSYSSYSRSSRSYSRSYSRSSRSYSRSYSRSSSRSYSSSSRSRSRSRKSGAAGWSSSDNRSRRPSPNLRDIYSQGANMHDPKQEEEVPWWAEFDKTYEIQKKAEKEAKLKAKAEEAKAKTDGGIKEDEEPQTTKPQASTFDFSDMTSDDIDVVRCLMSVVDKACRQQDPVIEDTRRCLSHILDKVSASPELQTPEAVAKDCIDDLLDKVCPDDPVTIQRLSHLSESESKPLNLPPKSDDGQNKLLHCYSIARHVTDQTRAMRRQAKLLSSEQNKSEDGKESDSDQDDDRRRDDRRGRHGRRRRRSKTRRRRRRSYSRSSYSSSDSEKRSTLVNLTTEQQQSLQQAQQMLILQQQQLQAAGILPKSLALPTLPTGIPSLIPNVTTAVPEPEVLSNRWDKDMDALLKTKSKDDLTRKLMQRMKEKKQLGETGDLSPTFLARNKGMDGLPAEKVFSGAGNLKSRKIAISSIDKSKVFEDVPGYKKSDIAAAQATIELESSKDSERSRAQEQREKLEAWSDEQKVLKEEVKRKMREEIEKAERAKKELIKEQMLEAEKQKEIMRIREEVREQIKKEIRDEIEKQRKQVLEDPELKSQLMELEALRQSKIPKSDASAKSTIKPLEESFVTQQDKHKEEMNTWLEQNGKRASDMSVDEMRKMQMVYMQQLQHWSQQQQKTYMQWYWHQQQHYQQHNQAFSQNNQGGFYNRTSMENEQQRSHAGEFHPNAPKGLRSICNNDPNNQPGMNPGSDTRASTFTHAPSKGPDMEGTTHSMPPRGVMSSHTEDRRHLNNPPNRPPFFPPPPNQFNDRRNMPGNFPPQNDDRGHPNQNMFPHPRGPRPPHPHLNQPRFNHPNMHRSDMPDFGRQFSDRPEPNQAPLHQYPPSEFDGPKGDDNVGKPPVSGMHGPNMNRFGQQKYDELGHPVMEHGRMPFENRGPRFDQQYRPVMSQHGQPLGGQPNRPLLDQHGRPIMDQRNRPPLDQHGRPLLDQHGRPILDQLGRPPMDPHGRPMLDQHGRPLLDQHGRPVMDHNNRPPMDPQHPTDQQGRPLFGQAGQPPLDQSGRPQLDQHGQPIIDQKGQLPRHPSSQKIMSLSEPSPTMNRPETVQMGQPNNEQPPPPGVDSSVAVTAPSVDAPPGVDDLAPPGEESHLIDVPPEITEQPEAKTPTPTKSSKKKKKKHRKHKKKRDQSSSSEDDDAQRSAIMEQLKALQAVEDGELAEVEDGEVQSDDDAKPNAIAAATALLKQLEAKKKKKHKKRKRKRRETSSEEEDGRRSATIDEASLPPPGIPPPPFFQEAMAPDSMSHSPAPAGSMPANCPQPNDKPHPPGPGDLNASHPDMSGLHPIHQQSVDSDIHPIPIEDQRQHLHQHRDFINSSYAPHMQQHSERYNIQPNPQGAGEPHLAPHEMTERNNRFTHFIGPGGDHTLGQSQHQERKRSPSPLPLVIPSDPREMEVWARRMEQRYTDDKPREDVKSQAFGSRKIEKIPSLMDKHAPHLEPRHIASLGSSVHGSRRGEFIPGGRQHPDDDRMPGFGGRRKRERGPGRGRGRKRRRGMSRNYHDWDQPADDGLIYYYSGSDHSSGWGSDKDFDDLLAKKKRESIPTSNQDNHGINQSFPTNAQPIHVTNTRRPSPVRRDPFSPWDRPDHMGEPQGIPVIGSSQPPPQPIPSLANRGGPPMRNEYDHLGRPLPREDEFKIHQDYSAPNDQQMMLRNIPPWDHPGPMSRDLPPGRPGDHLMRGRLDPLRRPF